MAELLMLWSEKEHETDIQDDVEIGQGDAGLNEIRVIKRP